MREMIRIKVIIHRGTNQIGGCLTEIQSDNGTKILIDIGANLPDSNGKVRPEIELEGLTIGKPSYDAIFITHYHGDHIGLYNKIKPEIPIYIGKISKGIYMILHNRLSKARIVSKEDLERISLFNEFTIKEKILIKDITITPIETDHSAFDSYMFLIEANNKKLLHTGDFRTHGQRGRKALEAIKKYVGEVDCLICEGTTLTRNDKEVLTESQLQIKAKEIFEDNKYNFILCSSTNIDRIAAFHKAALGANKMFICDRYQCEILKYISQNSRNSLYKFNENKEMKVYTYGKNMLQKMKEYGFVMLVRPTDNFKQVVDNFNNYHFIYSQWLGYLEGDNEDYKRIQDFTPKGFEYLHTSGHATSEAIKNIIDITNPKVVIPIHTEGKEKIKELTDKSVILEDNEEFEL